MRKERVVEVVSGREFRTDKRTNPVILADEESKPPSIGRRFLNYVANIFKRPVETINYAYSDGCSGPDDKHLIEDAQPPFYSKCTKCHQRFYLISESALRRTGFAVMERPLRGSGQ